MFEGGDTNLYGYTWNDPVNWIDPAGTNPLAIIAAPYVIEALAFIGSAVVTSKVVNDIINVFAKQTGKEKASDIPSWAKGQEALPGEKPTETADRIVKEKYGPNYPVGPTSDYNKIKKYFERKPKCP